jgi:hypothetical protein
MLLEFSLKDDAINERNCQVFRPSQALRSGEKKKPRSDGALHRASFI